MKKMLLLAIVLAFSVGSVSAGPNAYIGLYVDDAHTICRQDIAAAYATFTLWVWTLPNDYGTLCVEYKLVAPAWLLAIGTVENPLKSVVLGTPYGATGVSFCYSACQYDWVWMFQITQLPMEAGVQDFVLITERPDAGAYQISNCFDDTYPLDDLIILNHLALNQDCIKAAENSSWGAIKAIYGE